MHTLSNTLLHVHRLARQFPLADFRADALSLAKTLLPFDANLWCEGAAAARTVTVEHIHACPGFRPQADVHRQAREYARLVFARRQRFAADGDIASRRSSPSRAPDDITLCAIDSNSQSTLILGYTAAGAEFDQWIALHRIGPFRKFSPLDQRMRLDLVPHLMEAMNARRVYCAEQGGRPADQAEFTASTPSPDTRLRELTAREFKIASLVPAGRTHKEIARLLAIAPSTVRNHIQRIHDRLKVRNNVALAAILQQHAPGESLG